MTLALHLAATRGNHQCCAVLLEHGADINGFDMWGNHPIESAAAGLHTRSVQLMITNGNVTKEGLNRALLSVCMAPHRWWPDVDKKTFYNRKYELACCLLQHGADPNYRDDDSDPPLKQAIGDYEDCSLALLLLEHGADPTEIDEEGETLLEFARTDRMKAILQEWTGRVSCHH
jgi:ankyrin repeat protein